MPKDQTRIWSAIVGNPPYTVKARTGKNVYNSIYPLFFGITFLTGKKVSLITPTRWFNSNNAETKRGREEIIRTGREDHFRSIYLYKETNTLFPILLRGGISYWLYDEDYRGESTFFLNGRKLGKKPLLDGGTDTQLSYENYKLGRTYR